MIQSVRASTLDNNGAWRVSENSMDTDERVVTQELGDSKSTRTSFGLSQSSSSGGNTSSSNMKSNLPLPDQTAFASSSGFKSKRPFPFDLTCPPTPSRTPGWTTKKSLSRQPFFDDIQDSNTIGYLAQGGFHTGRLREPKYEVSSGSFTLSRLSPYSKARLCRMDSLIETKVLLYDLETAMDSGQLSANTTGSHVSSEDLTVDMLNGSDDSIHRVDENEDMDPGVVEATPAKRYGSSHLNPRGIFSAERLEAGVLPSLDKSSSRSTDSAPLFAQSKLITEELDTKGKSSSKNGFDNLTALGSISFEKDFVVHRLLGQGSFSRVLEVESLADGRRYAVKRALHRMRSKKDRDVLIKEAKLALRAGPHPHLVRYSRCWQESGFIYFQCELCEGGTVVDVTRKLSMANMIINSNKLKDDHISMADLMDDKKVESGDKYTTSVHAVPERFVWTFIAHVAAGLKHLHEHGVVHMDIKPENVLVGRVNEFSIGGSNARNSPLSGRSSFNGSNFTESSMSSRQPTLLPLNTPCLKIGDLGMAVDYAYHPLPASIAASPTLGPLSANVNVPGLDCSSHSAFSIGESATFFHAEPNTSRDDTEGDSRYMAPELLEGGGRAPPADIFSLGMSALELAWNVSLPVEGQSWRDVREGKLPSLDADLNRSQELVALITVLLNPNPVARPSAADILKNPYIALALSTPEPLLVGYMEGLSEKRKMKSLAPAARKTNLGRAPSYHALYSAPEYSNTNAVESNAYAPGAPKKDISRQLFTLEENSMESAHSSDMDSSLMMANTSMNLQKRDFNVAGTSRKERITSGILDSWDSETPDAFPTQMVTAEGTRLGHAAVSRFRPSSNLSIDSAVHMLDFGQIREDTPTLLKLDFTPTRDSQNIYKALNYSAESPIVNSPILHNDADIQNVENISCISGTYNTPEAEANDISEPPDNLLNLPNRRLFFDNDKSEVLLNVSDIHSARYNYGRKGNILLYDSNEFADDEIRISDRHRDASMDLSLHERSHRVRDDNMPKLRLSFASDDELYRTGMNDTFESPSMVRRLDIELDDTEMHTSALPFSPVSSSDNATPNQERNSALAAMSVQRNQSSFFEPATLEQSQSDVHSWDKKSEELPLSEPDYRMPFDSARGDRGKRNALEGGASKGESYSKANTSSTINYADITASHPTNTAFIYDTTDTSEGRDIVTYGKQLCGEVDLTSDKFPFSISLNNTTSMQSLVQSLPTLHNPENIPSSKRSDSNSHPDTTFGRPRKNLFAFDSCQSPGKLGVPCDYDSSAPKPKKRADTCLSETDDFDMPLHRQHMSSENIPWDSDSIFFQTARPKVESEFASSKGSVSSAQSPHLQSRTVLSNSENADHASDDEDDGLAPRPIPKRNRVKTLSPSSSWKVLWSPSLPPSALSEVTNSLSESLSVFQKSSSSTSSDPTAPDTVNKQANGSSTFRIDLSRSNAIGKGADKDSSGLVGLNFGSTSDFPNFFNSETKLPFLGPSYAKNSPLSVPLSIHISPDTSLRADPVEAPPFFNNDELLMNIGKEAGRMCPMTLRDMYMKYSSGHVEQPHTSTTGGNEQIVTAPLGLSSLQIPRLRSGTGYSTDSALMDNGFITPQIQQPITMNAHHWHSHC